MSFKAVVSRFAYPDTTRRRREGGAAKVSRSVSRSASRQDTSSDASDAFEPSETSGDEAESPTTDFSPASSSSKKRQRTSPVKSSPSAKSRKSPVKKYSPPEIYAHLKGVTDQLGPYNVLWTCGINPGKMSAEKGWAYAHPSNHFWKGLGQSGLTDVREHPSASANGKMLEYNYGMTNLVDRPTTQQTELSVAEQKASVPAFIAKCQYFKPRLVSFIGKKIFDYIFLVLKAHIRFSDGRSPEKKVLQNVSPRGVHGESGLFPLRLKHGTSDLTYLYVQYSTSGLCRDAQLRIFEDLKLLVDALRLNEVSVLDARHDEWLELDVDAFLTDHPPAQTPQAIQASLAMSHGDVKPVMRQMADKVEMDTADEKVQMP